VLFGEGRRIHLELGHHPFRKGRTYEDELGKRGLKDGGRKQWNKRLLEAIDQLKQTFIYDRLYIGGGNTKFIKVELPADVVIVSNEEGLLGGIKLWEEATGRESQSEQTTASSGSNSIAAPPDSGSVN
jgi:polyphosphate glucokinase